MPSLDLGPSIGLLLCLLMVWAGQKNSQNSKGAGQVEGITHLPCDVTELLNPLSN